MRNGPARPLFGHFQAFWKQHVAGKFGVIAAVTRLRVGDNGARLIGVARHGAAGNVSPAVGVFTVPVIVLTGSDYEGDQTARLLAVGEAVGDLMRAVALGGSADVSSGNGGEPRA